MLVSRYLYSTNPRAVIVLSLAACEFGLCSLPVLFEEETTAEALLIIDDISMSGHTAMS